MLHKNVLFFNSKCRYLNWQRTGMREKNFNVNLKSFKVKKSLKFKEASYAIVMTNIKTGSLTN